jgi:hypothetical protein
MNHSVSIIEKEGCILTIRTKQSLQRNLPSRLHECAVRGRTQNSMTTTIVLDLNQ